MSKVEQLRALREQQWKTRGNPEVVRVRSSSPAAPAGVQNVPSRTTPPKVESSPPPSAPQLPNAAWESGLSIHQYSDAAMTAVVSDVLSKGISEPEAVLEEVMRMLGFQRRGKIIRRRVLDVLELLSERRQVS